MGFSNGTYSSVVTTVTFLSRDLQVMWDPETSPARASSLSFKPWCAPRTATVTTSQVWGSRQHHAAHAQGMKGIPIYLSLQFTIALIWSDLLYRKSQCTLSVMASVQPHLFSLFILDLVTPLTSYCLIKQKERRAQKALESRRRDTPKHNSVLL